MSLGSHRPKKSSKATLTLVSLMVLTSPIGMVGCNQTPSNKTANATLDTPPEIRQNLASTSSVTAIPANHALPASSNAITARETATASATASPTLLSSTSTTESKNSFERTETNLAVFPTISDKNKAAVVEKPSINYKISAIPNATPLQQSYLEIIRTMQNRMMTEHDEADKAFAKNMLAHHQSAISLAKLELKYGKDETLLRLAQDITTAQQAEMDILKQWLNNPPASKKASATLIKTMQVDFEQNAQDMSMAMAKGVSATTADMIFTLTLLPHHKGALAMAETELKYGKDKAMRQMAISIISSQQGEITLLKNWLASQHKR